MTEREKLELRIKKKISEENKKNYLKARDVRLAKAKQRYAEKKKQKISG